MTEAAVLEEIQTLEKETETAIAEATSCLEDVANNKCQKDGTLVPVGLVHATIGAINNALDCLDAVNKQHADPTFTSEERVALNEAAAIGSATDGAHVKDLLKGLCQRESMVEDTHEEPEIVSDGSITPTELEEIPSAAPDLPAEPVPAEPGLPEHDAAAAKPSNVKPRKERKAKPKASPKAVAKAAVSRKAAKAKSATEKKKAAPKKAVKAAKAKAAPKTAAKAKAAPKRAAKKGKNADEEEEKDADGKLTDKALKKKCHSAAWLP